MYFWKPENGNRSRIIPDIVIKKGKPECVVLETKWENPNGYNPSPDDLRQLYVYHEYYRAQKVALVYPGINQNQQSGKYLCRDTGKATDMECSIVSLTVQESIGVWQQSIYKQVMDWLKLPEQNLTV